MTKENFFDENKNLINNSEEKDNNDQQSNANLNNINQNNNSANTIDYDYIEKLRKAVNDHQISAKSDLAPNQMAFH